MDNHHIAGKSNSPITITVPANYHRAELSVLQHDWPAETLENPDGCPLLRAAACIRGFSDIVAYLIKEFLLWIADMLVIARAHLVEKLGSRWWEKTELNQFSGYEMCLLFL